MKNKGLGLVVAGALLLQGCAGVDETKELQPEESPQVIREREMHERWSGRDYGELVAELGEPIYEMTIPRYGWPNSRALLYGEDQETGCVDAFLIVRDPERTWVETYFCR